MLLSMIYNMIKFQSLVLLMVRLIVVLKTVAGVAGSVQLSAVAIPQWVTMAALLLPIVEGN
ncbi:hypothetical protein CWR43_12475 [Rhizobium sullae]|uniref:Uncharacterized protein n=1 Tax=Rhizobium sullae TaxID=50338 RepID=A0A2N0D9W9_RHISU|nr:hypothetical protein CWR43_12475 [Rhizobium sullae]